LKLRYWWVLVAIAVILVTAVWIDWPGLQVRDRLQRESSLSSRVGELELKECASTQGSYSGPIVPDQTIQESEQTFSEISPDDMVPANQWSSKVGFGISAATDPRYWAQMLGSGWYIDWNVRSTDAVNHLVHWQMIRVHEDCISPSVEDIQAATRHSPGQVWIIGNEPDVIWQDNVTPTKYASIYHDLYTLIKSADPTALIAVGGVSQATPLRLQYLDKVLQTYQALYQMPMPVDWWTLHGYVLSEEKGSWGVEIPPGIEATQGELREVKDHGRLDLFEDQIRSFRQWMAERGYQNTPLALTEFGILMPSSYGFPSELVASYLEDTFTWLAQTQDDTLGYPGDGYHLVQKWAWFSISDPTYSNSDLGDLVSGKLTLVGESFRKMVFITFP